MSTILRIFRGAELTEKELGSAAEFTFGSGKKDTVCIEDCGLAKRHLALQSNGEKWQWKAAKPVKHQGKSANEGSVEAGEILLLDQERRLAVMVVERDPDDTRIIDLAGESKVRIGRSNECDIVIGSRQISGKHLELRRSTEGWSVRDMGSSNGTYVNGKLVRETELAAGDVLDIGPCRLILTGDHLSLTFRGSVKSNLIKQTEEKTADTPEDTYPYQFHRSPRLMEDIPEATIEFEDAPSIGGKPNIRWSGVIIPPLANIAIIALVACLAGGSVTILYFSVPMTLVSLLMSIMNYRRQNKDYKQMEQLRLQTYDAYLDQQEQNIQQLQNEQWRILTNVHPITTDCLAIVLS